ncbi:MAG: GYD domain-containing protein, partial [Actinomycetota bacterium]|nr:GYD domain-containing protein [Actinomycetota bacterium]
MALYMTQFSYTSEAWAALASNPEDRSEAIRALVESMGGQLVSFYYSFGEYDGVAIYEVPDES